MSAGEELMGKIDMLAEWMGFALAYRTGVPAVTFPAIYIEEDGTHTITRHAGDTPQPWKPLTDANTDLDVLKHAREMWGHSHNGQVNTPEWEAFERAVAEMCHIRRDVDHVTQGTIGLMARFVPRGVWSRAVLAVLTQPSDGDET